MKIGLISDTHSYIDDTILNYLSTCDEVWHAGDFGNEKVLHEISQIKPLRGVYGNIDGTGIRKFFPEKLYFKVEGLRVFMIHIGGYPGRYAKGIKELLIQHPPDIFISGHSHILKVMRDQKLNNMLHLNPGAAGHEGFHQMRTMLRFNIENGKVSQMEVIEFGKRGIFQRDKS